MSCDIFRLKMDSVIMTHFQLTLKLINFTSSKINKIYFVSTMMHLTAFSTYALVIYLLLYLVSKDSPRVWTTIMIESIALSHLHYRDRGS